MFSDAGIVMLVVHGNVMGRCPGGFCDYLLGLSEVLTVLYCTVLYCTVLFCTVLYCTVLYCTVGADRAAARRHRHLPRHPHPTPLHVEEQGERAILTSV